MELKDKISIIDFSEEYKQAFQDLNEEWIKKYFELEDADIKSLSDPQGYILDKGGLIKFAELNGEIVGTCALIKINDKEYELAKMAVSPKAQGKKIGVYLAEEIIQAAKNLGAEKVILLSNRGLTPAINLYKKLGFIEVEIDPSTNSYKRADIKMEIIL